MARKWFFRKRASRLCRYPGGQKFHWNRSSSLCFRDKRVFRFTQKFMIAANSSRKMIGCKLTSRLCIYLVGQKLCRNCSNSLHFRDKRVLIGQPFCIGSLPKVHDFQSSLKQTYKPNFMWIGEALFKLSPFWKTCSWSCDFSDRLKCHDTIFRNFSQGYCIHVLNLKRIHPVIAEL